MWEKLMRLDVKWLVTIILIVIIGGWLGISNAIKRSAERKACEQLSLSADSAFAQGNYMDAEKYYKELVWGDRDIYNTCPNRPVTSTGMPIDNQILGELQEYNRAARNMKSGDYYRAIFTLKHNLQYPGEMKNAMETLLMDTYQLLVLDTGESGKKLMLDMHENVCGIETNDILPFTQIINPEADLKYWYPGADATRSTNIASFPAEYQIAVCPKITGTNVVETCVYTSTGSAAATGLSASTVRKSAVYEIQLKDILSGETIGTYQPVYSKPPYGCPANMQATNMFNEIIGEPDFTTAKAWLDEQIELMK